MNADRLRQSFREFINKKYPNLIHGKLYFNEDMYGSNVHGFKYKANSGGLFYQEQPFSDVWIEFKGNEEGIKE